MGYARLGLRHPRDEEGTPMATQTTRLDPLNVVRAPLAEAVAGENLEFFGGKTLPRLEWTHVYLGHWAAGDRRHIDKAVPAAMNDARLNRVLAQYFPHGTISAVFRGAQAGPVP